MARVVPEIDVPAHAASWRGAHPAIIAPCHTLAANFSDLHKLDLYLLDPTVEVWGDQNGRMRVVECACSSPVCVCVCVCVCVLPFLTLAHSSSCCVCEQETYTVLVWGSSTDQNAFER